MLKAERHLIHQMYPINWFNMHSSVQLSDYCQSCEHHRDQHMLGDMSLDTHRFGACVQCPINGACSFDVYRRIQAKQEQRDKQAASVALGPKPSKLDWMFVTITLVLIIVVVTIGGFWTYKKPPLNHCLFDADCGDHSQYCDLGKCRKLGR